MTESETLDEVRAIAQEHGERIIKESRLPNDLGWQVRMKSGLLINVFDTGVCNVQGKKSASTEKLQAALAHLSKGSATQQSEYSRKVFVIYGHDTAARDQLEVMLRRWNLEPILLDQLPSQGQTLIEKLEQSQAEASYAVVLATPDDEGHRAGKEDEKNFRARQNVVLELGMMLATLGRQRVAILYKGGMELPSDIAGLIYIPFGDNVADARIQLAQEINGLGISINMAKL